MILLPGAAEEISKILRDVMCLSADADVCWHKSEFLDRICLEHFGENRSRAGKLTAQTTSGEKRSAV